MRRWHKLRGQWFCWLFKWLFDIRRRVIWSDVCTGGRNPTIKLGMRESMGGDFLNGGDNLNILIMWGGIEINFCLMRGGGYDLVLEHILPISQLPLQVIVAQSLSSKGASWYSESKRRTPIRVHSTDRSKRIIFIFNLSRSSILKNDERRHHWTNTNFINRI